MAVYTVKFTPSDHTELGDGFRFHGLPHGAENAGGISGKLSEVHLLDARTGFRQRLLQGLIAPDVQRLVDAAPDLLGSRAKRKRLHGKHAAEGPGAGEEAEDQAQVDVPALLTGVRNALGRQ